MNDDNTVNDVITDSISQLNTLIVGSSVPQSLGMLDITGTETLGMSMHNAVTTQQNAQISASAAVTATCARIIQAQGPAPTPTAVDPKEPPPPFMPLGPSTDLSKLSSEDIQKLVSDLQQYMKSQQTNPKTDDSTTAKTPETNTTDTTKTPPVEEEKKPVS